MACVLLLSGKAYSFGQESPTADADASVTSSAPRLFLPGEPPQPATLQQIDCAAATFRIGEQLRQVAIRGIVRWGDFRQPARGPYLVLADGGVLPGDPFEADGKKLALDTNTFGLLTLPVEQVAGIVFSTPPRQQAHDKLYLSLLDVTERSDLLLLENGDRVSGLFLGIDADVIRFRSNLGEFEASFRRVTAVVLNPALRKRPPAEGLRLWAGFADGSRLLSSALTTEGNALRVGSSAGELSALLTKLTALQPLGGRPVYLSELDPADYRQIPYLDLAWPFTHDRSVGGGLLRPGNPAAPGQIALKGLAVHSAGRLSYDVSAGFERFEAELAIDAAAPEGSVRFRIFADGQPRFASGDIRGGMPPVAVSVPIEGAKRLDLVVDFGERGSVQDHADWLNARLIRPPVGQ